MNDVTVAARCLGSAGCQPAVLGSFPSTFPQRAKRAWFELLRQHYRPVAGRLPATARWQRALPRFAL